MSFWKRAYVPPPGSDRLAQHGDYAATRARFQRRSHSNLRFLVRERYAWMNPYLAGKQRVVELGAGPGLSRECLDVAGLELTDVLDNPWIDRRVDAMALPYAPASLDAVICSHMIHHVAAPVVRRLDQLLVRSLPGVFALARRIVIVKNAGSTAHALQEGVTR